MFSNATGIQHKKSQNVNTGCYVYQQQSPAAWLTQPTQQQKGKNTVILSKHNAMFSVVQLASQTHPRLELELLLVCQMEPQGDLAPAANNRRRQTMQTSQLASPCAQLRVV